MSHASTALLVVALAGLTGGASASPELDRLIARDPAEITTTARRTVRGVLDGIRDGRLHVRLATDGGEVGYTFTPAEIERILWPGRDLEADALDLAERGAIAEALPLLEALARHRLRYLPLLDPARQRLLWVLAEHAPSVGDPDRVRPLVRAMAPLANTRETKARLLEAELGLALRAGEADEIRALARAWCALADPAGDSALGWRALADLAYSAGAYEDALWLALQPVTFSTHLAMAELEQCHALAAAAADRLGDTAHARLLVGEMRERGLVWPDDARFAGLRDHYEGATGADAPTPFFRAAPAAPSGVADSAPPPLASIRKLVRAPAPAP